jgi:hypothetical protein
MPEAPQTEPEWVQRMRAAGYNIRRGTRTGLSEIPDVMFPPPVSLRRGRFGRGIVRGIGRLFRVTGATRKGRHAHLP